MMFNAEYLVNIVFNSELAILQWMHKFLLYSVTDKCSGIWFISTNGKKW